MYKQRFMPPTERFTPIKNYLHIGYIATRPRSIKNEDGIHGLFGYLSPGEPCDKMPWQETARHVRQMSKQNKNIFRAIISFDRPDSDRLGLVTQKDWREYAEQHIRTLAEKNNIGIANLGWCGAFHDEGAHPHLHIAFWDRAQAVMKTFVPPSVPNDIRVALIKSTFAELLQEFYEQKKQAKDAIYSNYSEAVSDFDDFMKTMRSKHFESAKSFFDRHPDRAGESIAQLFRSDAQLADAAERLFALRGMIPKGGRIAYKLLPPDIKWEIDSMADWLIEGNEYLLGAITQYIDSMCSLKKLYASLDDPGELDKYRMKCYLDAKRQVCYKIVSSVKAIISKEYEIMGAEYMASQKHWFALRLVESMLDAFARSTVANASEWQERQGGTFGDISDRALKEWYLKNKDKGLEF
ncbi:MAG: relaxase MobL [Deltaproteobacteria bacterium]|jgi:hypothetical protein|nr:relaxase MobL [Deltaproteobacteria bacterium]